jgi:1,2-diacylglycerol 3-beta-glucosyltransferase
MYINIIIFAIILAIFLIPVSFLLLIAIASIRQGPEPEWNNHAPVNRFMIAIPAHDEASVIEATIHRLQKLNYPSHLFSIHIVADHCSDQTAESARNAGAIVHERREGPRTGKGAALSWLFHKALKDDSCEAVIIFDADTQVDPQFLRIMDRRLEMGAEVIQAQHIISNPDKGWFPLLTWAMFLIDNRFQNLGRSNLGWSAKNMGDSICFRTDVLRKMGWGEGLTEDYQLRQRLLLESIKIRYEPTAHGYGEAPLTWLQARAQRARWLRGTSDASQQFARRLLANGIRQRDWAQLDGALQAYMPSYSTLSLLSIVFFLGYVGICALGNLLDQPIFSWYVMSLLLIIVILLLLYPLAGLALEHAPLKAYLVILSGPFFIVWRTWLALTTRKSKAQVIWVRTQHGNNKE